MQQPFQIHPRVMVAYNRWETFFTSTQSKKAAAKYRPVHQIKEEEKRREEKRREEKRREEKRREEKR
ncbi:MAG: hypothetical protein K2X77_13120, partial [Candidatus Obscuribacterales bacterium]|nr:hypothetical protein [Candidatus Obscuribacterales bacterium]